jgi:LuxR family maltose regulon positive regulatory protein
MGIGLDDGVELHRHVNILPGRAAAAFWDAGAAVEYGAKYLTARIQQKSRSKQSDRELVADGTPLTAAELRLLPYLQTHLTFREIGERLFVSRNTVSSEVGSIYRSLGVSSRSDAVGQATTVGLLGG